MRKETTPNSVIEVTKISTHLAICLGKRVGVRFKVRDGTIEIAQSEPNNLKVFSIKSKRDIVRFTKTIDWDYAYIVLSRERGKTVGGLWNSLSDLGRFSGRCLRVEKGFEKFIRHSIRYASTVNHDFYFFPENTDRFWGYYSHHDEILLYLPKSS